MFATFKQLFKSTNRDLLIRPAKEGRGIIAGGPVRIILELAGVKDVVSKSLGSNTKINTSRVRMDALVKQRSDAALAGARDQNEESIKGQENAMK